MKNRIGRIFVFICLILMGFSIPAFAADAKYIYGDSTQELSFTDAWNKAGASGGEIRLLKNVTLGTCLILPEGQSVTLNLNGCVIDRDMDGDQEDDGNLFTLEEGSRLTITDSEPDASHKSLGATGGVLMNGGGDDVGGCIHMEDSTTLVMTGGTILNCTTDDHGGAIRVDGEDAVITLDSVTFLKNRTEDSSDNCHGGAIYSAYNCTLTATDCLFKENSSEDCGGAVYLENKSYAVFTRCKFDGNTSEDEAGAVFQDTDSTAIFEYCTFCNNYAEDDGGAIYIDADETTKIQDCTFYSNRTDEYGSAIYINDEACYIIDSSITKNKAGEYGAVYVDAYHSVDVMGKVVIQDNLDGDGEASNVYLTSHDYLFGAVPIVAQIYDGGLYEESYIGLSYDGNVRDGVVSESISEYQLNFFHSDSQKVGLCWSADETQYVTELLISSAIDDGYIEIIIVCLVLMVLAGTTVYVKKRSKKGEAK